MPFSKAHNKMVIDDVDVPAITQIAPSTTDPLGESGVTSPRDGGDPVANTAAFGAAADYGEAGDVQAVSTVAVEFGPAEADWDEISHVAFLDALDAVVGSMELDTGITVKTGGKAILPIGSLILRRGPRA